MKTKPHETEREAYLRKLYHRQTVIFGSIISVMVVCFCVGLLIWTGILPAPYNPKFTASTPAKEKTAVVPCIPEGTKPLDMSSLTARVYNATDRQGLAGKTAQQLKDLSVQVTATGNWKHKEPKDSAIILTGTKGVPAAYTLARTIPGATIHLDPGNKSAVLDVILGGKFEKVLSPADVKKLSPTKALESLEHCAEVDLDSAHG